MRMVDYEQVTRYAPLSMSLVLKLLLSLESVLRHGRLVRAVDEENGASGSGNLWFAKWVLVQWKCG